MQDNLVIWGGCGAAWLLGNVGPEMGLPSIFETIGPWGVIGMVLWFIFTRLEKTILANKAAQEKVNESLKLLVKLQRRTLKRINKMAGEDDALDSDLDDDTVILLDSDE